MTFFRDEKGFSIVEVLIALGVFAIGFLAMAKMQMVAIHGNQGARGTTEASSLLQEKIDELRLRQWPATVSLGSDATCTSLPDLLCDNNADLSLGEPNNITIDAVGVSDNSDPAVTYYNNRYQVFWNVVDNQPVVGVKMVRVIVVWNDRGGPRRIFTDFVRNPQF